jgi:hypothetical protein
LTFFTISISRFNTKCRRWVFLMGKTKCEKNNNLHHLPKFKVKSYIDEIFFLLFSGASRNTHSDVGVGGRSFFLKVTGWRGGGDEGLALRLLERGCGPVGWRRFCQVTSTHEVPVFLHDVISKER